MTAEIIDGKAIAAEVLGELQVRVDTLIAGDVTPGLAVVLVGDHPASATYVRGKMNDAGSLAMRGEVFRLPANASQEQIVRTVQEINADPAWHGQIVQLPLPDHVDEEAVLAEIDSAKDVDGAHPASLGKLLRGQPAFLPATPHGVQQLLLRSGHSPEGKHVVVCGRSNLVGKPLAVLLMQKREGANATVTVCHTGTRDLASMTRTADILVAAMGSAGAIGADMVREGAIVIDVGTNSVPDPTKKSGQRLVGDVDFDAVSQKAAAITPVPGGVGPMTRAMLLWNTVLAAEGGPGHTT
jgi:methylenetetrahydrofolate dehydrogenase (NADP+) / methenyltetrahydrofolate cyclohydrolase